MSRARVSLRSPPEPRALAGFPRRHLDPATPVFRVVRRGQGPWWFSSDGTGRFDLEPPSGTCYLATTPVAALLELLGPELAQTRAISTEALEDRDVRELRLPRRVRLADAVSRRAAAFGVTAELTTIVPYALPRAWARALAGADFAGIRHAVRHDPEGRPEGVALFDAAGERKWRRGRVLPPAAILAELESATGIRVLPRPTLASLDVYRPEP
ncbi:MAG TPA: RES family NAD+ phosphorylase [Acidimicrobiia bacterium]|nr:RES family NAD+ phosphorylase [Acidimicrobiia bacterium]